MRQLPFISLPKPSGRLQQKLLQQREIEFFFDKALPVHEAENLSAIC
jgi:hypothetical protein